MRCPTCREKIRLKFVRLEFSCPSCGANLYISNPYSSVLISVGFGVFILSPIILLIFESELLDLILSPILSFILLINIIKIRPRSLSDLSSTSGSWPTVLSSWYWNQQRISIYRPCWHLFRRSDANKKSFRRFYAARACNRLRFQAMQTRSHSPRTDSTPRRRNWRVT